MSQEEQRSREMYMISGKARDQLNRVVGWHHRHVEGEGEGGEDTGRSRGRHIRIARTTTSAEHPSYPARPANTFVVEFGTTEFTETPGLQTLTFEPYDPEEKRVARDLNCTYHEEGELVFIVLVHDQWHIIGGVEEVLALATLNQNLCGETTGIEVTGAQTLPSCVPFSPTLVTNTHEHKGPNGSLLLMVRKACKTGSGEGLQDCSATTEEWLIFDIQLREYCPVVGIEDRPSCLVAAGLRVNGEWCPDDEPTTACNIVDYIDCETELDPCDTDWTFTPLYACCGQGEEE